MKNLYYYFLLLLFAFRPVPVPIQVLGAEASAPPERNSSPIPPKPDSGRGEQIFLPSYPKLYICLSDLS